MKMQITRNVVRAIAATALVVAAGVAATVALGDFRKSDAAGINTLGLQAEQISGLAGKCMTATSFQDGADVVLATCDERRNQVWYKTPEREVMLYGRAMCLDVAWASKENAAKIQVARCNGGPGQKFRFEPAGDLVNISADKCVTVKHFGTADGTPLLQWQCLGGADQEWRPRIRTGL